MALVTQHMGAKQAYPGPGVLIVYGQQGQAILVQGAVGSQRTCRCHKGSSARGHSERVRDSEYKRRPLAAFFQATRLRIPNYLAM
jgi:hypothetical protein